MVKVGKQTICLVLVNGLSPVQIAVLKIMHIMCIKRCEFYPLPEKVKCESTPLSTYIQFYASQKPSRFMLSTDKFSMMFTVEENSKNYLSDYLLFCVSFRLILNQIGQCKNRKKNHLRSFNTNMSTFTLAWYKQWRLRAKFIFAVRRWPWVSLMVCMTAFYT